MCDQASNLTVRFMDAYLEQDTHVPLCTSEEHLRVLMPLPRYIHCRIIFRVISSGIAVLQLKQIHHSRPRSLCSSDGMHIFLNRLSLHRFHQKPLRPLPLLY